MKEYKVGFKGRNIFVMANNMQEAKRKAQNQIIKEFSRKAQNQIIKEFSKKLGVPTAVLRKEAKKKGLY